MTNPKSIKERIEKALSREGKVSLEHIKTKIDLSTPANAWYAHPYEGQVRGPYNRWLHLYNDCFGGELKQDGRIVRAYFADDINYAATAMTELPNLVEHIIRLESFIRDVVPELAEEIDAALSSLRWRNVQIEKENKENCITSAECGLSASLAKLNQKLGEFE